MRWRPPLLAAVLAATSLCSCRETQPPADLIITGARLIDAKGQVHETAELVIEGDRIAAVSLERTGRTGRLEIKGSGATLLAGLIDVHVHLLVSPAVTDEASLARQLEGVTRPSLESFLQHGVTTIRSTGDPTRAILALREEIEQGVTTGPRLFVTGPVLSAPGGHPSVTVFAGNPFLQQQATVSLAGVEDAHETVAKLAALGVDGVKIVYQGSHDPESRYLYAGKVPIQRVSPAVMEAVIEASHRHGLPVTAHTFEEEGAVAVVEAGIDSLEHGVLASTPISPALIRLLIQNQLIYVPTLQVFATRSSPEVLRHAMANLGQLATAGVTIALGTDTVPAHPAGLNTIREMKRMVEAGLSPAQVLQAATLHAARLLGRETDLGSLEVGKLADLVMVYGDPLEDIAVLEQPRLVVKGGQVMLDRTED